MNSNIDKVHVKYPLNIKVKINLNFYLKSKN